MTITRHIYSVSELNNEVRFILEKNPGLVWLEAEISSLARPASGHWYFSLKDSHTQIRCAFFKQRNRLINFGIEDGQKILARGRVSLYEPRGDYQLIVDHLELAGEGELQRQYELLKHRLQKDGLFDDTHKKPLPTIPECIGVITSVSGAAIRDILHVLNRRYPAMRVIIYPSLVQGEGAAANLTTMLRTADRRTECDVLLVTRGGGSLEDLWAFNDEKLARAVFQCKTPIISGVGHEIDFTICDFVADVRAPTPSAAAEIVSPDVAEMITQIQRTRKQLHNICNRHIRNKQQKLDWLSQRLTQLHPGTRIELQHKQLIHLKERLINAQSHFIRVCQSSADNVSARFLQQSPLQRIARKTHYIEQIQQRLIRNIKLLIQYRRQQFVTGAQALNAFNPLATLSRGYSITRKQNVSTPILDVSELKLDDIIETQLHHGQVTASIQKIES